MEISSTTVAGLHLELNHPMGTQRLDPYPDFHQQNGSFNNPKLDINEISTSKKWEL